MDIKRVAFETRPGDFINWDKRESSVIAAPCRGTF